MVGTEDLERENRAAQIALNLALGIDIGIFGLALTSKKGRLAFRALLRSISSILIGVGLVLRTTLIGSSLALNKAGLKAVKATGKVSVQVGRASGKGAAKFGRVGGVGKTVAVLNFVDTAFETVSGVKREREEGKDISAQIAGGLVGFATGITFTSFVIPEGKTGGTVRDPATGNLVFAEPGIVKNITIRNFTDIVAEAIELLIF